VAVILEEASSRSSGFESIASESPRGPEIALGYNRIIRRVPAAATEDDLVGASARFVQHGQTTEFVLVDLFQAGSPHSARHNLTSCPEYSSYLNHLTEFRVVLHTILVQYIWSPPSNFIQLLGTRCISPLLPTHHLTPWSRPSSSSP
jgi:hypothetical protein